MSTEQRHSYGVLPILHVPEGYKFLLVNQIETNQKLGGNQEHWTLAKGTPEKGETPLETALRETEEEVGIVFDTVSVDPSFTNAYSFVLEGKRIDKQVTYFLGFTDDASFTVQEKEIKEATWLLFEDARKKLTFEHSKVLLDEVFVYLKKLDNL